MTGKIFLIPSVLAPETASEVIPSCVPEAIKETDYYFAEEIRTARRFISALKVSRPIEDLIFFQLNKDTTLEEVKAFFLQVPVEKNIGIISEAGCPGIADPGSLAVAYAHQLGREVVPLPGPSSIFLALMGSGFNGQSFCFHGYLPIEQDKRIKAIKDLEKESRQKKQTQIFMETPYRNNKLAEDVLSACAPETLFCLASNLTAKDQFIKTLSIRDWKGSLPDLHKKPVVFLIYAV